MGDEALSVSRWHLAASVGAAGGSSLEIQRELSPTEAEKALNALGMVGRLTSSSRWNVLLDAWRTVESHIDRTQSPANLRILDETVYHLLQAMRRFGIEVMEIQADNSGMFTSAENLDPNRAWATITGGLEGLPATPFRCIDVVDVVLKPGQVRSAIALSAEAARYLSLDTEQRLKPKIWLETATALAERVHASLLRSLNIEITQAAKTLQQLGAEVLLGATVLVTALDFDALSSGRSFQPTIRELPLEHLPRLMLALRNAMESAPVAPAAENEKAPSETETSVGDNEQSDQMTAGPTAVGETPLSVTPQPAADPVGLHAETNRMSEKLERLWTKSLERVLTDEVLADEVSRWQALLACSAASMLGEAEGAVLPQFPLSAAEVANFVRSDSGDRGSITHLYAVVLLSDAIQEFDKPRLVIDATAGTLEPWWNSGGFARLRDAGDLLLRSVIEMGQSQNSVSGVAPELAPSLERVALGLADRCLQAGAPEASLTYLLQAWMELESKHATASLAETSNDAFTAFTELLPGLRETAARFGSGDQVSLRVSLPLAFTGVNLLNRLIGPRVTLNFDIRNDQN